MPLLVWAGLRPIAIACKYVRRIAAKAGWVSCRRIFRHDAFSHDCTRVHAETRGVGAGATAESHSLPWLAGAFMPFGYNAKWRPRLYRKPLRTPSAITLAKTHRFQGHQSKLSRGCSRTSLCFAAPGHPCPMGSAAQTGIQHRYGSLSNCQGRLTISAPAHPSALAPCFAYLLGGSFPTPLYLFHPWNRASMQSCARGISASMHVAITELDCRLPRDDQRTALDLLNENGRWREKRPAPRAIPVQRNSKTRR